jgi:hypothetical protein
MWNWNWIEIEIAAADHLIRPRIGPGSFTKAEAHAEVEAVLARLDAENPGSGAATILQMWRDGARDDTVYWGPWVLALYSYPAGEDPKRAAWDWAADFAETMRSAGVDVQVARKP